MFGVTTNPRLGKADEILLEMAKDRNVADTFRPTEVGVFFGEENKLVADPYFNGEGPARVGCNFCGGCMVGCRYNSKNTLPKNYLYFAEKMGVTVLPESVVRDIRPVVNAASDGIRYEVHYRKATAWLSSPKPDGPRAQCNCRCRGSWHDGIAFSLP